MHTSRSAWAHKSRCLPFQLGELFTEHERSEDSWGINVQYVFRLILTKKCHVMGRPLMSVLMHFVPG